MDRSYNRKWWEGGYALDFKVGQSFGEPQRDELEENHGRFVAGGQIRISDTLSREHEIVKKA